MYERLGQRYLRTENLTPVLVVSRQLVRLSSKVRGLYYSHRVVVALTASKQWASSH